jgi:stearoyl-CoA desaturase (Delta-9 desaturase)
MASRNLYWGRIAYLVITLLIAFIGAPLYAWQLGLLLSDAVLFFVFFVLSGLGITLGYHRLFSHRAFEAHWGVRLATLIFGAGAMEGSVIHWCQDHRRHHRHTDEASDPHNRSRGFWHAHVGWALCRQEEAREDNVGDLRRDRLVAWQDRYYFLIGPASAYALPTLIGWFWNGGQGALGGFLVAGVARVALIQQVTFCINSICHSSGRQPYTSRCSAHDNCLVALFTFGEGYHNFHHQFQADYRNGVKAWQFDPTKWCIWLLSCLGLTSRLNRTPPATILQAERDETQRKIAPRVTPRESSRQSPNS